MRKRARLLCGLLLAWHLSGCVTLDERAGPFQGQIVDTDSGQPLKGAVVLAVWRTAVFSPVGHPTGEFHAAREAVTDDNGRFIIHRLTESLLKVNVRPPTLYFIAPGYLRSPYHLDRPRASDGGQPPMKSDPADRTPFLGNTIVPMRRVRSSSEWCRDRLIYLPIETGIPSASMPQFEALLRAETGSHGMCTQRIQ
jgi:hypothetical protein